MNAGPAAARRVHAHATAVLANPASTPEQRATAALQLRMTLRACPDVVARCARCGRHHDNTSPLGPTCATRTARLREVAA